MAEVPEGWKSTLDGLKRTFEWKDFAEALAFVVEVGKAAEGMNHHPDVDLRWNKVHLTLMTHSAGKVTDNDYELARVINGISPAAVSRHAALLLV